ncbi:DUF2169 domain-containing protein [bacterium]|nr:DUF2169 domain-containing protein [bacterium]
MSDDRQPVHERYDAVVDLIREDNLARQAYALVKLTYAIQDGRCVLTDALPLAHDLRDPDRDPPLPPGTDFWPFKRQPEFVVEGAAYPPGGQPAPGVTVSAAVGDREKRIAVFGDRQVHWQQSGTVRFGPAAPFTEMPLVWERAYGGLDWRTPLPDPLTDGQKLLLQSDHPGLYPRNPWGRGYLVMPEPVDDLLLPNLEDPADLLTPERLITGDPRDWWRQPLPWTFGWMSVAMFPRFVYVGLGADAWYPAPEGAELPEIQRGLLRRDWRRYYAEGALPNLRLRQEASHGFVLDFDPLGQPVELVGMHPERTELAFTLPSTRPDLAFTLDGRTERVIPRLNHVVCYPDRELVSLTYAAIVDLPRPFAPGIHKHIPVAVSVHGDAPLAYQAPTPVREEVAGAMAAMDDESPGSEGAR